MTAQPIHRHLTLALAGLAVVLTVSACSIGAGSGTPTSQPATPAPSATPLPSPIATPAPTADPTQSPGTDAMPITVDLETADGHQVRVDIVDPAGFIKEAQSGSPAEGVSVETGTVKVDNVDDRTLRLTWSDFAMDNALALYVDESGKTLILVQPEPVGPVDSIGADRQLVLTFHQPISAADLLVSVQDGIDTPGE